MLSLFLTHLNPSSRKKNFLAISDLTRLEMVLGELSIDYLSRVRGISQCIHGITMERIITLFAIATLDRDRYPGVKICYLAGNAALVNCNLLELSGLLPRKYTRQQALGITMRSTINHCHQLCV